MKHVWYMKNNKPEELIRPLIQIFKLKAGVNNSPSWWGPIDKKKIKWRTK